MLLKLQNIGKIYNSNDILTIGIRGVNLELDYNEFVTIEGESGSGKSTLLNVIGANDTYEEGELFVNGSETSHYTESEWEKYRERNIATIFQDFNIIENLTVLENVELALLRIDEVKERRRIARELISRVGLERQANQKGSKLSGGEKQRTVIARALAKDAPIILADEPTGNLDVKTSKEIAKLLKEVSKDKLVIVVTHNPEFFKEYATRRVRIFDGKISEDVVIEQPTPVENATAEFKPATKKSNFRNTLHIGVLNYKSRPKFTTMMTVCAAVCAVALFVILSVFGQGLIQPVTTTLDETGIEGKVVVTAAGAQISNENLDEIMSAIDGGYFLIDRELSEFTVSVPKKSGMLQSYQVTCLYAPYRYNLKKGCAVLVIGEAFKRDAEAIADVFIKANVGLEEIEVRTELSNDSVYLYLSHDDLVNNGVKIMAVNSVMRMGETETTVYTFEKNEELADGEINLVNSNFYDVKNMSFVFAIKAAKSYTVNDAEGKNEDVSGIIVQMSSADYAAIFEEERTSATQAVVYFPSNDAAKSAIERIPDGYVGILSSSRVYLQSAGDAFTMNIVWYLVLIGVSLCFAGCIYVIFGRSVKIYQTDFAVYRTLGISRKVSSRSLYIQMALIFLPTLALLPIVSLVASVVPGSTIAFIGAGNYFFIEIMILLIVEFVAYGFNKSINGQSIRKSLRRGSK